MSVDPVRASQLLETLRDAQDGATDGTQTLVEALEDGCPEYIALARTIRSVGAVRSLEPLVALKEVDRLLPTLKSSVAVPHLWFLHAALMSRAESFCQLNRVDEALDLLKSCHQMAKKLGSTDLIERVNIVIGSTHRSNNDPTSALNFLLRTIKQPELSTATQAECHAACADIYQDHGYWDHELKHRQMAVEVAPASMKLLALSELANSLAYRGHIIEARYAIHLADESVPRSGNDAHVSQLLAADAHVLISEGKLLQAKSLLENAEARTIAAEPPRPHLILDLCLARLDLANHKPNKVLNRLLPWINNQLFLTDRRKLLETILAASRELGDWKSVVETQGLLISSVVDKQVRLHTITEITDHINQSEEVVLQENALRLQTAELQGLTEDRDELIEIVANDLQTPLTTLKLVTGMVRDGAPPDSVERCLSWADSAISKISNIASKLELVADLEAQNWPQNSRQIDLGVLVTRQVTGFGSIAKDRSLVLKSVIEPGNHLVIADHLALTIILETLLENALNFTPPGGHIAVHLARSTSKTLIVVTDDGPGWASDEASELFKKHSRLSARRTKAESSSGLSLYIAQQLASQFGGVITANSPGVGKGACFTIVLPSLAISDPV